MAEENLSILKEKEKHTKETELKLLEEIHHQNSFIQNNTIDYITRQMMLRLKLDEKNPEKTRKVLGMCFEYLIICRVPVSSTYHETRDLRRQQEQKRNNRTG